MLSKNLTGPTLQLHILCIAANSLFLIFKIKTNKHLINACFATTLIRLHLLISERNNTVDSSNGCVCGIVRYMNFDINVTKNLLLSQLFVLISAINTATATVVAEAKMNQESFLKTLEDRFKYRFDDKGIGREVSTPLLVWIDVYTK